MSNIAADISVILPVYNSCKFLRDCLNSIIKQTFRNFEVIAVDDGSTDGSLNILEEYLRTDNRFKIYRNKRNLGVSRTSNRAIKFAKACILARMDADDVMHPQRLQLQYDFLQKNPEYVMVGAQVRIVDEDGRFIRYKKFPTQHEQIIKLMYNAVPLQQPTIMINRNRVPQDFKWYDERLSTAEDVDLYFRLLQYGKFRNLNQVLHDYREHRGALSKEDPKQTFKLTYQIRKKAQSQYGYRPSFLHKVILEFQRILIYMLPNKYIYPIYYFMRRLIIKK